MITFSTKTYFNRFSYKNLAKDIALSISPRIHGAFFPSFFSFYVVCMFISRITGTQLWSVIFGSIISRKI
jgi:hypothetical protein